MGLKRTRGGSSCIGYQHGGLNLHEIAAIQEIADLLDDLGSLDKGILDLRVHDQVHISLPIAGIRIRQAVEFLRQGLQ